MRFSGALGIVSYTKALHSNTILLTGLDEPLNGSLCTPRTKDPKSEILQRLIGLRPTRMSNSILVLSTSLLYRASANFIDQFTNGCCVL